MNKPQMLGAQKRQTKPGGFLVPKRRTANVLSQEEERERSSKAVARIFGTRVFP